MRGWPQAMLALLLALAPLPTLADGPHGVLMLFSNGRLLPANVDFDRGLREYFAAAGLQVELASEFLDAPRFGGEAHDAALAAYLKAKYALQPPQVVVVGGDEALDFVLRHRATLFADAPVIHVSIAKVLLERRGALPPGVIGVPVELDFLRTTEQALHWHPAARRLVVVTGTSEWDRIWEARIRDEAQRLSRPLELEILPGLPGAELKRRLGELGSDAIVYTPGYFRDGDGRYLVPRQGVTEVAAATRAPVYGPFTTFVGTGAVGGVAAGFDAMGTLTGRIVAELLAGAAPASIALPATMPMQMHVDWRVARRFGIEPSDLPPDAVVSFMEPSFWRAYGHWVVVAVAVLLLQALLIATLLVERQRRRRADAALAQSEQRLGLAAEAARLSTWIWDPGRRKVWFRVPAAAGAGLQRESVVDAERALAAVHPADRAAVDRAGREALASGREVEVEYRVARSGAGDEWRWMAARGRAEPGAGQRLLGVALDITPRKLAEAQAAQDRAALRHMTRVSLLGQLSASIAHQLNQPLAAILGNAEAAQKMLSREPVDLAELRAICDDIVASDHLAAQVIRRLGALFRRGEPQFAPLDVNELVRDTRDLTRAELLSRQVGLVEHLGADLPPIDGDRIQLQQMLLNLIINAADAVTDAEPARREVTISTARTDAGVEICVADRGPGIADGDGERIFDPFWSTKSDGMGVGLAICRSIALAHHGSLSVANAPSGGAVFCAVLPAGEGR